MGPKLWHYTLKLVVQIANNWVPRILQNNYVDYITESLPV